MQSAYARQDRTKDAQRQLETTLNLEPENYRANLVLGRMLTLHGKTVLALPYLKKAALLQPGAPDPHLFLADTFAGLGQKGNAHSEQAEGQRLRGTNER
jgi:predicted Zn-dependent protease